MKPDAYINVRIFSALGVFSRVVFSALGVFSRVVFSRLCLVIIIFTFYLTVIIIHTYSLSIIIEARKNASINSTIQLTRVIYNSAC